MDTFLLTLCIYLGIGLCFGLFKWFEDFNPKDTWKEHLAVFCLFTILGAIFWPIAMWNLYIVQIRYWFK